jgi:gluconolactonase
MQTTAITVILTATCLTAAAPAGNNKTAERNTTMTDKKPTGSPKGFDVIDEALRQILLPDSQVRRICNRRKFTEGPVWLAGKNCLLFSDIPADTIHQWTEAGGMKVFRKPSHNANGNTTDLQGRLITCEHGSRTVTRTERSGKVVTIASSYLGRKLNSPNDVVVKSDGTIWFTDPPYGIRPEQREQKAHYVFRLDKGAAEPVAVADDFDMPNGLCFSPDEKHLYVADSGKPHHVRRLPVLEGNRLGKGNVFAVIAPGVPDGIRVDVAGRLYSTAGDGVQVFDVKGKLIGRILTPAPAANCCFGGPGRKTLFITARDGVYMVRLAVAGRR